MKIGFITDSITTAPAGIGRYAANVFAELTNSGNELLPIDWRHPRCVSQNLCLQGLRYLRIKNNWPLFKTLFWHLSLLPALKQYSSEFDVLFNPSQFIHLRGNLSIPYAYVVHDLSFFNFPRYHKRGRKLLFLALFGHTLKKADSLVCVSKHTRSELLSNYPEVAKKTTVIYEAAEERFHPIENEASLNQTKNKYSLPDNFLLYVGTIEPRKNLDTVFLAYSKLRHQIPLPFYIAGKIGWRAAPLFKLYEKLGIKNHVRFLGYVPDKELPALYNLSTALVYISKDEGFGLPVLEAMQCGTPVMISDAGSLPEIAGNAAMITSASDPEAVGESLANLCLDDPFRKHLREKGFKRAAEFSWRKTGIQLTNLFESLTT
jgi:glycosyltransferase involved in cell wall biosynthesis